MKVRIQIRNSKYSNVITILSSDKKISHVVMDNELHKFDCSLVDLLASYKSRNLNYYAATLQSIMNSFTFVDTGAQA